MNVLHHTRLPLQMVTHTTRWWRRRDTTGWQALEWRFGFNTVWAAYAGSLLVVVGAVESLGFLCAAQHACRENTRAAAVLLRLQCCGDDRLLLEWCHEC